MRTLRILPVFATMFLVLPAIAIGKAKPPVTHQAAPAPVVQHDPSIDDVMRMRVIVGVEVAPTGRDAVLQIQEYVGGPKWQKDLWRVVPGGEPKRLTTGGRTGGSYTYSPDGARIAFLGERGGKQGIQVLPLDGGEARTVLETPFPVENLRWVGGRFYFTAAVMPACAEDLACTARTLEERAKGTSALVYTELYHRPWNTWADGTRNALFTVPEDGGKVTEIAGGTFDAPPIPFGGREDYDVAADGAVVYTAKKVPDPWKSTNSDLFLVEGGKELRITQNPAADRAPRFSVDGRFVAYLAQAIPGFESDLWRLKVYDRKLGETFTLAEGIDNWIAEFAWAPDGRTIVFSVEEQGHQPLYVVEVRKGAPARRITGRTVDRHLAVAPGDGRYAWVTRESLLQPPELIRVDLGAKPGPDQFLTNLNGAALAAIRLPRIEEIWWDGAEVSPGKRARVHGFLAIPAGTPPTGKWPLVMVVHGGPQGAWMNGFHPRWNPLGFVGRGVAVAMPNPTGSVGYGQAFTNAVSKDWGGRPYEDLMFLLDDLSKRTDIDGGKACAIGGSYGGYMANWMEAKTDRFKCLVSHAGPSFLEVKYGTTDELWFPEWDVGGTPWDNPDNYRKFSPSSYVRDFKTPMLVIQGANDFRVPLEQALFMFTALRTRGIEAKLVVFPDEDHFVAKPLNRKFWYDTVNDWLSGHLQEPAAPK